MLPVGGPGGSFGFCLAEHGQAEEDLGWEGDLAGIFRYSNSILHRPHSQMLPDNPPDAVGRASLFTHPPREIAWVDRAKRKVMNINDVSSLDRSHRLGWWLVGALPENNASDKIY